MSKLGKITLSILCILIAAALALGITFSIKNTEEIEQENTAYAVILDDLEKELNYNVENVSKLEAEIELKGLTIEDLTRTVTVYEKEIVELEKVVVEKETEIIEKTEYITEKETEIIELEKVVVQKEVEVKEVEKVVVEYQDRIVYLESESVVDQEAIAALREEISNLNARITALNEEIADLKATLASQEQEIEDLRAKIQELEEQKTVVETQIVEKEVIIVEKEEIIVEKEAEIQELVVNVEVLNTTIVELNVQITLLEEALDKEVPDREELRYLFSSGTVELIQLEDGSYLASSTNNTHPGLFHITSTDFSVTKIYDRGYMWTSYIEMEDGILISPTMYSYELLLLNKDGSFNRLITSSYNYNYFYELENKDIVMYGGRNTACAVGYWDKSESTFTHIGIGCFDTMIILDDTHLFFPGGYNYQSIVVDLETLEYKSFDFDRAYFNISAQTGNGDVVVAYSYDTVDSLYVWKKDINEFETITFETSIRVNKFVTLADGNIFIGAVEGAYIIDKDDFSVIVSNNELTYIYYFMFLSNGNFCYSSNHAGYAPGIMYFNVSDYTFSFMNEDTAHINHIIELSTGNLLLYNDKGQTIIYYDIEQNVSVRISPNNYAYTDVYYHELSNGKVLISNSNAIFELDTINLSSVTLSRNQYYYYDTFIEDENGVIITSSTDESKVALYYSFETGLLSEINN